tara:strand:+ start:1929 stop:3608 length:1680 start_codon:yes stop_codon:yes gene_type:complete
MSIVPRSARYNVLPMGIPSQRRSVRQGVQTGNSFKPDGTKIIRINLPQQSYLDCANTYLCFRHKIVDNTDGNPQTNVNAQRNNGANNEICMDNGAFSWIRNLQIQGADGSVLENIQNYNLLSRVLHRATQPEDHSQTSANVLQGYGDINDRQSWGTNTQGHTYAIQLSASGILANSKYIPLKYLQGGLTLQLELEDFARCHQAKDANYTYIIDQVYLHMDLCDFSDEFDAMFRNQLASEGVNIHFDTYSSHIDNINDSGDVNIEISERASSVKSVYTVMRKNDNIQDITKDSLGTWTSSELDRYRYTLGTTNYPRYDVDCKFGGAIAYAEMLKGFGVLGDINGGSEIDTNSWRGVASDASAKYLEIQLIECISSVGKQADGRQTTARLTFNGKHGMSAGTNATHTGTQFTISNCAANSFNADGTVGADNPTNNDKGCWICEAVISDTTIICERVFSALGATVEKYTAGTGLAVGKVAYQGFAKVASSATDGKDVRFMLAQNFENHFENQILQTGVSASGAVPLALNLNVGSSDKCRVDTFVHSDKMLTIGADGLATVSV